MAKFRALGTVLVSGLLIASALVFTERVGGLPVAPVVISTNPPAEAIEVPLIANFSVAFNKDMNTSSEKWNITPFVGLAASWWNSTTLNFTHVTPLLNRTNYWISVTANDTVGTPVLHWWHKWRFTTECNGTCIKEMTPADGEKNILPSAPLVVTFANVTDFMAVNLSITPSLTVTGTWSGLVLTFTHAPFQTCTQYSLSFPSVLPGPAPNRWSFTTTCPGTTFVDVAATHGFAGIDGSFMAWGDYNRDGYEDLLMDGKRLFRNNGPPNYDFTEVTMQAGIGNTSVNNGVWGDYNNDGWLDFYAPGGGWSTDAKPSAPWDILWMNNGDGTFTNVTVAAGNVKDIYPSVAAGWGDYDRDGYVDLYVANYENSVMSMGYPDRLWHNDGDGTFTDVTNAAKIADNGPSKPGRGVAWGDYNNDGWPDVYISNYRITANYLWRNNGDGTFTDAAPATNTSGWVQGNVCYDYYAGRNYGQYYWGIAYGHTIGSAWADFNNDGNLDIFTANLAHRHVGNTTIPGLPYDMRGYITENSVFYRNDGPPYYNFTDVRPQSGIIYKPTGTRDPGLIDSPFAPCLHATYQGDELFGNVMWADYDLDGYQDVWLTQVYGNLDYSYSYLYHNNHDGTFSDVTSAAGVRVWGGDYAGAWADYNDDGYPDLITHGQYPIFGSPSAIRLFENQGNGNSWLKVRLNGCTSNTAAIGARILATAGGMTQMRNIEAGSGSHSQMNSLVQEFGFGGYAGAVDLDIRWPNNNTQSVGNVAIGQTLRIQEPGCTTPARVEHITAGLSAGAGSDVMLDWSRAMGDDGWAANVTNYAVYYSTVYDPTAASYSYLGQVPAGTTLYVHVGGGIGDTNTYYYALQTNGTDGHIMSMVQAVKFAKHLLTGEQLVSIPVPLADYSISIVLRGIPYSHLRVYDGGMADPWRSYDPSRSYNDLASFAPYQAFWIGVTGDCWFTVAGPILPSATIQLRAGWNLVGYASTLPRSVASAMVSLGSAFRSVEGSSAGAGPYFLRRLGPGDVLNGGEGYWVCVGSSTAWLVPFKP